MTGSLQSPPRTASSIQEEWVSQGVPPAAAACSGVPADPWGHLAASLADAGPGIPGMSFPQAQGALPQSFLLVMPGHTGDC